MHTVCSKCGLESDTPLCINCRNKGEHHEISGNVEFKDRLVETEMAKTWEGKKPTEKQLEYLKKYYRKL